MRIPRQDFRLAISVNNAIDAIICILDLLDTITREHLPELYPEVNPAVMSIKKALAEIAQQYDDFNDLPW